MQVPRFGVFQGGLWGVRVKGVVGGIVRWVAAWMSVAMGVGVVVVVPGRVWWVWEHGCGRGRSERHRRRREGQVVVHVDSSRRAVVVCESSLSMCTGLCSVGMV